MTAPSLTFRRSEDPVPYRWALAEQRLMHAERVAGQTPDTCWLLEHESVYTAGRSTHDGERPTDGSAVVEVDRGGRITWHGPGQLTGYPIVAIPADRLAVVRVLQTALVATCAWFGVEAGIRDGRPGVWIGDGVVPEQKVAAIGVRIRAGVSMHGFALNCDNDLAPFQRIVPCGIADAGVTTLSAAAGRRISVSTVRPVVEAQLSQAFEDLFELA